MIAMKKKRSTKKAERGEGCVEHDLTHAAGDEPYCLTERKNVSETCLQLRELASQRRAVVLEMTALTHRAKSLIRRSLGWRFEMTEKESKPINDEAARICRELIEKVSDPPSIEPYSSMLAIQALRESYHPMLRVRKLYDKTMAELAETTPGATFAKEVCGFSIHMLAQLIGETGDLSGYANKGRLWKRMGMVAYKGKMPSTWRMSKGEKLSAEEWTDLGYCPSRRALMHVIGECLMKSNGSDGEYKRTYDERKAFELARDPEMKPIIAHKRAMLIMEKRLLKHLWIAWRREERNNRRMGKGDGLLGNEPRRALPTADEHAGELAL